MFKVLRLLPNHVKKQRILVHILYYISFGYLDEMSKTMFECEYYTRKVVLSYVAVFKLSVVCFHLGNFSCANASLQVAVAKVEDGANITIQSCSFTS